MSFVNYDGITSRIVRPNIECTNGYIHLIDKVVMKVRNLTFSKTFPLIVPHRGETSHWELLQRFFHQWRLYCVPGQCLFFSSESITTDQSARGLQLLNQIHLFGSGSPVLSFRLASHHPDTLRLAGQRFSFSINNECYTTL